MNQNIKIPINVTLGRSVKELKEVKNFEENTIIELGKCCGSPVEIYAGDYITDENLIARGEVVVIDENFAVRVTEIIV